MAIVKSLSIDGLWGDADKKVHFDFHKDVNFIIGVNGSGKTTVINMLAAALLGDWRALSNLAFKVITIKLDAASDGFLPTITLKKIQSEESPELDGVEYSIRLHSKDKLKKYTLHRYSEEIRYRTYITHMGRRGIQRSMRLDADRSAENITDVLERLVSTSWLSVHRSTVYEQKEGHKKSPVDIKLGDIIELLGKYFTTLDKRSMEEQNSFQEKVFLASLYEGGAKDKKSIFEPVGAEELREEQDHLEEIFTQFEIFSKGTQKKVANHIKHVAAAMDKVRENPTKLGWEIIMPLVLNSRIDSIIDEWQKFNSVRAEIYQPKEKFLQVINGLFQRKEVFLAKDNEIKVKTQSEKELPASMLSSGEKQLLIVLGQALLQSNNKWVYIADEPELSLHVKWQDELVNNIRILNPQAQIIFATHSPDIVGEYGKQVFDMESLL